MERFAISKRKRFLSKDEYNRMVNESFSDSDESDDSFMMDLKSRSCNVNKRFIRVIHVM